MLLRLETDQTGKWFRFGVRLVAKNFCPAGEIFIKLQKFSLPYRRTSQFGVEKPFVIISAIIVDV